MECMHACALSHVQPFPIPWSAAARLLCSWNSPGKNTGGGLSFPTTGDLPDSGIKSTSPASPASGFLTTSAVWGFPGGSVLKDKHGTQLSD